MQTYYLNDFKVNIPKYILPGTDTYLDPANVDFEVRLFVPPSAGAFVASHIGGKYVNCKVADGQICIIADGHQLAPGEVWYEAKYHLPDSDYPDGYCTLVEKSSLGLSLTISADVEVREEQEASVAELQREQAEATRVAAEQSREQAEANRVAAESQRAETFAGWREVIEGSGSATSPTSTFDAQWTAAGGTVITPGKVYECNGTDDLTFAESLGIYEWYTKAFTADCSYRFEFYPHRAMLPVCGTNEKQFTADRMFYYAKKIKVIKFRSPAGETPAYVSMTRPTAAFMRCEALREIDTPIQFTSLPDSAFGFCAALEEVRLYKLAYNVSFDQSPILSLASLQYLVENATNTKTITVTVHPDVYAKLTGDITNAAAAALTAEELAQWQQVLTDAMAKNISFATI